MEGFREVKDLVLKVCITICFFVTLTFLCLVDIFLSPLECEEKHKCTTFVKYEEHYQITPLTWGYRSSFKCIECGKDYKKL